MQQVSAVSEVCEKLQRGALCKLLLRRRSYGLASEQPPAADCYGLVDNHTLGFHRAA